MHEHVVVTYSAVCTVAVVIPCSMWAPKVVIPAQERFDPLTYGSMDVSNRQSCTSPRTRLFVKLRQFERFFSSVHLCDHNVNMLLHTHCYSIATCNMVVHLPVALLRLLNYCKIIPHVHQSIYSKFPCKIVLWCNQCYPKLIISSELMGVWPAVSHGC